MFHVLRGPPVSVDGPRPPELAFVPREEQFDGGEQDPEVFEAEVDSVEVLDDEVIPVLGSGRQNAEQGARCLVSETSRWTCPHSDPRRCKVKKRSHFGLNQVLFSSGLLCVMVTSSRPYSR